MIRNIVLVAFVVASFFGCSKIDELTKFNIEYSQEVTIPSSTVVDLPFDIFTPDIQTNSQSKFDVNDTRKDLIEAIKLTDLKMTIQSPADGDFSFLKSIEIYIAADGLEETKIAYLQDIPDTIGKELVLETSDVDLKEYIKKDQFNLRLQTVTDKVITTDHKLQVNSTFFVDAKILGI